MKVLILTVTAGYGHNSTALAIEEQLLNRGVQVKTVDAYKYVNKIISETLDKTTALYARYTPDIYRLIYEHLDKGDLEEKFNIMGLVNAICSSKFEKLIDEYAPDVVVCTHVFAAQLMNELKLRNRTNAKIIGIITDYTIHPYWETLQTIDYCIIANEKLRYRAVKKGIPNSKIMPLGIPISAKFNVAISKQEAKSTLGITNRLVVLVMGGGLGLGFTIEDIGKMLEVDKDLRILIVCGKSKSIYRKFENYKNKICTNRIDVYGFVDNVDVMMSAADVFVSKPGGLSVSEAFAKDLPMIIVNPLAGQEERNSEFLLNCGLAMFANKTFPIDEALHIMLTDESVHSRIVESIDKISVKNAAQNITEFLLTL